LIKVLVVDDEALLRSAFSSLIEAQDDLEVVGAAGDGQQAVDLASRLAADVVVMDVRMPVMDERRLRCCCGRGSGQIYCAVDMVGFAPVLGGKWGAETSGRRLQVTVAGGADAAPRTAFPQFRGYFGR
jgi:hypothetical protein